MGKPKVEEQLPTAQEVALFDINRDKIANYDKSKPYQNELIRRTTGHQWDADAKRWDIDPSAGVVGAGGQVQVDNGRNFARAQQQWKPLLQNINPNSSAGRTGRIGLLQDKMRSDAGVLATQPFQQQTGYLQAMQNVAGVGRGQQAQTLGLLQGQAGNAAQTAAADARTAFQGQQANQQAVQGLVGMGSTLLMSPVQTRNPDGSRINGAYDQAFTGFLGNL